MHRDGLRLFLLPLSSPRAQVMEWLEQPEVEAAADGPAAAAAAAGPPAVVTLQRDHCGALAQTFQIRRRLMPCAPPDTPSQVTPAHIKHPGWY